MIAHSIFFYFFSIIAVISAIMVTVSKNTVHSVFFLILDFISISCLFIMAGLGFKIAVVPFHAWAPDVYEGAPTPVTTLLAAASKAMGFVAVFRVFVFTLDSVYEEWELVLGRIALASMTVGNLAAISQNDIGRMLGY